MANLISEADFSRTVEDLLNLYNWRWCHFRAGRVKRSGIEHYETPLTGYKGFPDYVAVKKGRLILFELKSETGKLSEAQIGWIRNLKPCVPCYVWRPSDFEEVKKVLEQ